MSNKRPVLFSDYAVPSAAPEQKQGAKAAALAALRAPRRDLRFTTQLRVQLAYIHPAYWLATAAMLAAVLVLTLYLIPRGTADGGYLMEAAMLLGAVGPALAAIGAPELAKSYTHNMWELENASVHSLPRLLSIRMLITAGASLPILLVALVAVSAQFSLAFGLLVLVAPFLFSCTACYLVLGVFRGIAGSLTAIAASLLVAAASWVATFAMSDFHSLPIGLAAAGAGGTVCALAIYFTVKNNNPGRKLNDATGA